MKVDKDLLIAFANNRISNLQDKCARLLDRIKEKDREIKKWQDAVEKQKKEVKREEERHEKTKAVLLEYEEREVNRGPDSTCRRCERYLTAAYRKKFGLVCKTCVKLKEKESRAAEFARLREHLPAEFGRGHLQGGKWKVTNALIQAFGGVDGLIQAWTNYLHVAEEKRDHKFILRTIAFVFASVEKRHEDVSLDNDKQVQEYLSLRLHQLIRSNPKLVMSVAKEMGWLVIPPED